MSGVDAHVQAILARLRAAPGPPPLVVLDGVVPAGVTPPYVLLYFTVSTPAGEMPADSTSIDMTSDRLVLRAYSHSVGANAQAARMVADRVWGALFNAAVQVPGRTCWPVRHDDGQPMTRDESTGVAVMDQVDVWRLETIPA